jgi:hypothetical protein
MPDRPEPRPAAGRSRRDEVIQALSAAFAQDELTVEEFERRLDLAHRAHDTTELHALLSDLRTAPLPVVKGETSPAPAPAAAPAAVPAEVRPRDTIVAIMAGVERGGPWVPARSNSVFTFMGGVDLDFREARLGPGVTELTIFCGMGGVDIIVPPGMIVDASGTAIMGGFGRRTPPPAEPGAPVLRIRGLVMMGGVDIEVRRAGESRKDARRRERKEKRLRRGQA